MISPVFAVTTNDPPTATIFGEPGRREQPAYTTIGGGVYFPKAATAHAEVRWVSITLPCRQQTLNHKGGWEYVKTSPFQLRCCDTISEFGQRGGEQPCCSAGRQLSAQRCHPCPSAAAVVCASGFCKIRNDPPVRLPSENGIAHYSPAPASTLVSCNGHTNAPRNQIALQKVADRR